jgi:hypothetical protein
LSFVIHHLEHERKHSRYHESSTCSIRAACSPTQRLHLAFFEAIGKPIEHEDPLDRLLDVHTQLGWLREIGFDDADCYWKWLEMALILGVKP